MGTQTRDDVQKKGDKKPAQQPYVPQPELGESGDVNAMPQEGRATPKEASSGKRERDEHEKASG